jgi:hypothetical protein
LKAGVIVVLRAFAWMRWRILMNSIERTGARDTLERFSVAIEQLGPIFAAVLMIPSAVLLAGAGAYGGWALAGGNLHPLPFEALRYIFLAATVLTIIGPFMLPAAERTNAVRLLLLPIPRWTLYAAQSATALTDPWLLLLLPAVAAVPLGALAGAAPAIALAALAGGALFMLVLVGVTSIVTSLIHLVVRNRRRGELMALVLILFVPLIAIVPGLLAGESNQRARVQGTRIERRGAPPGWFQTLERGASMAAPSELYVRATRGAAAGDPAASAGPIATLVLASVLLHAIGMTAFARVLDAPGSSGGRRGTAVSRRAWTRRLPGLSPGASAVAIAHARLAVRTPRGRSILLSPLVVFMMFAVMMWRSGEGMELGLIRLESGIGLAAFTSLICLVSILPIAMNQFAIDGAGLTLALLSPLDSGDLLRGKAVGNALVAALPASFCVAAAAAVFPGGDLTLWLSIPPGLLAVYLLVAPAAAIVSAIFPRAVDMNSIGRRSNAHGAAGLLGLAAFTIAAVPCALLVLLATRALDRPSLAPLLLAGWCLVCWTLAWILFIPARAIFERRRENLGLIV